MIINKLSYLKYFIYWIHKSQLYATIEPNKTCGHLPPFYGSSYNPSTGMSGFILNEIISKPVLAWTGFISGYLMQLLRRKYMMKMYCWINSVRS